MKRYSSNKVFRIEIIYLQESHYAQAKRDAYAVEKSDALLHEDSLVIAIERGGTKIYHQNGIEPWWGWAVGPVKVVHI